MQSSPRRRQGRPHPRSAPHLCLDRSGIRPRAAHDRQTSRPHAGPNHGALCPPRRRTGADGGGRGGADNLRVYNLLGLDTFVTADVISGMLMMLELVPFSGIQFIDFEIDLRALDSKARRFGIEREESEDLLVPLEPKDTGEGLQAFSEPYAQTVIDFDGKWLPAPIFKNSGQNEGLATFEPGPTTWARMRIDVVEWQDDSPVRMTVQFAIDTVIDMTNDPDRSSRVYYAPNKSDVESESSFELVTNVDEMGWFLQAVEEDEAGKSYDPQEWVTKWLARILQPKLVPRRQKNAYYWAHYLTLIEILGAVSVSFKLINNLIDSAPRALIDTTFVLDLGNSRTCGILLEKQDGKQSNIHDAIPYKIRNLTRSKVESGDLLDSRVELCKADFGFDDIAMQSGRKLAFLWPSPVRLGAEALDLQRERSHGQGPSGLSSAKRYLWDRSSAPIPWEFNSKSPSGYNPIEEVTRMHVSEEGNFSHECLAPLPQNTFSRSSFMMFMISELIAQALMQINNPQDRLSRPHSGLPRRLSKIILTIPTATPAFEQNILRRRAEDALNYVWQIMEIPSGFAVYPKPELIIQWDEASCSQQVFLFNEIGERFAGKTAAYFAHFGSVRTINQRAQPSLRIASIDIGGGTTDLMITTYAADQNEVISPYQEFRESFRIAGDDLLKSVIELQVLPAIENILTEAGGRHVSQNLASYFKKHDQERTAQKAYFANSFLKSVAVRIIGEFEANSTTDFKVPVLFEESFSEPGVQRILNQIAERCGIPWPTGELTVDCHQNDFNKIVQNTFYRVSENIESALKEFPCDFVLLTGRPSKLNHVRRLFAETFAVHPSRLISMHSYVISEWYPFRDPISGKIGDPKSTVTVGALLNSISRADLANYSFTSEELKLKSTSNFIGEMNHDLKITDKNIIVDNINKQDDEEFEFIFTNAMYIASRQIDDENWVTLPLYSLILKDANVKLPLKITARRPVAAFEVDEFFSSSSKDYLKEYLKIVSIEDSEGGMLPHGALDLQFNTLGFQRDYWLESGIFS